MIVSEELAKIADRITLKSFSVTSGTDQVPTATVQLEVDGKAISQTGTGDGPVDAVYRTIASITQTKSKLLMYVVKAITGGTDAQGEVSAFRRTDAPSPATAPIRISSPPQHGRI